MNLDNFQLKKLRERLPNNYAKTVSKNLNVSASLIYKVLHGSAQNVRVLKALISLAEGVKKEIKHANERVSAL